MTGDSNTIKPISYLKAHAAEIIREIINEQKTMIITQNGEAKAVLQDIKVYAELQESLALLKILALGNKKKEAGEIKPMANAFKDLRKRIQADAE